MAQELEAITEKLAAESRQGKYRVNRGTPITPKPVAYSASQPQATWVARSHFSGASFPSLTHGCS